MSRSHLLPGGLVLLSALTSTVPAQIPSSDTPQARFVFLGDKPLDKVAELKARMKAAGGTYRSSSYWRYIPGARESLPPGIPKYGFIFGTIGELPQIETKVGLYTNRVIPPETWKQLKAQKKIRFIELGGGAARSEDALPALAEMGHLRALGFQ